MPYAFDWIDAFTTTPFGGNGCVVVHDAGDLPVERRLALVRETKLSECAYLQPSDTADFGVRYYLAAREIPFAGHPTIATVASLVHRGLVELTGGSAEITLETGAGVVPIRIEATADGPRIAMRQARPEFGAPQDPAVIAAIYGLDPSDFLGVPRIVSTGTPFCIARLASRAALDRAQLDPGALEAWRAATGHPAGAVMEPFLTITEGATPAGDTYSRLLLPAPNPPEDPFTGSATGCMAAYLWAEGALDAPDFTAEQGHGMGRPGEARIRVLGPRDAIEGVEVSGHGVVLMSGALHV